MASIKKFNWVQRPSMWQYAQAWNAQRKNMAQRFMDEGAAISNAFMTAQTNQSSGMANLAAQAAITTAQKKLEATKSQISSIGSSLDLSA
jgi:hypothetical protein